MAGSRGPTSALAGPQPKAKAKAKVKAIGQGGHATSSKSKMRQNTGGENTTNEPTRDGDDEREKENKQKKKRQKADPQVMARLQKLDIEKNMVLTTDKWSNKIKEMNKEVTGSMAAAENFEQTKGFLSKQMGHHLVEVEVC